MYIYHQVHIYIYREGPSADPESFVRGGGPTLTTFFFSILFILC